MESTPAGDVLHLGERRLAKRQLHPLPGVLRYGIAASETPVRIHDFSAKGLCFRGEVRLPIGAAVEITTNLPQTPGLAGRKVRYLAHVVRVTREPGKFVTAVLIFSCETLAQESPETIGAEPPAGASSGVQGSKEVESRPKAVASTPRRQAAKPEPQDYRQFSRYHCASQVQYRMADGGVVMSGEVSNLSLAGCFVQTAQPCPVGSSVEIVVQAGKARIYSQAQVKSVKENQGMAVEFVGELAERLQRLPRFVQMVSARPRNQKHN
ncbi:MAG TPA: PilZ domain-containing protein [Terriglobales bacterium]|nr:PilZ domain-containing protein [Terriglobales bacterium]